MPALEKITTTLNSRAEEAMEHARLSVAQINATRLMIEGQTEEFMRTGIAFISNDLQHAMMRWINEKASAYFRELAKETGRSPLIAEEQVMYLFHARQSVTTIAFTMPKTKRLKNVISGMLLLAQEAPNDQKAVHMGPVASCSTAGTWRLFFNGKEGRDLFESFRERCHTDPILRVTLRLNS